jgi:hypothetical protein
MPSPKISTEQAAIIDAALARQDQYLCRLAARLKAIGVNHAHPLIQWAEKAEWHVSGLRSHFAEWAKGQEPHSAPKQIIPAWRKAREQG